MTKCGWASIDERGKASGGKVGDQTGREVKTGDWYQFGQKYVIRYKDAKMARRHATILKKLCNANLVGYDQNQRTSLYTELKKVGFTVSKLKAKCEADCSSLQNACAIAAGAKGISPSWATGTMLNGFDGIMCMTDSDNRYRLNFISKDACDYLDKEYIIIDGASSDNTCNIIMTALS